MIPRLGKKYSIEIEIISKPSSEYRTEGYAHLGLPLAPAIMVGGELIAQGCDADENEVEAAICRHLGILEPAAQKKGIIDRFFGG